MKTIIQYECEKCKIAYETQEECQKCEDSHINPKEIISSCFIPYVYMEGTKLARRIDKYVDCTYPTSIFIRMEDGKEFEYKIKETKYKKRSPSQTLNEVLDDIFKGEAK